MKDYLPYRLLLFSLILIFANTINAQDRGVRFSYLGQYSNTGVPAYIEPTNDVIGQDFLKDINTALPEKSPVPGFHPEYILQRNETDVVLKATADIWITFVQEKADFTNALGFYTYPTSAPPRSAAEIKSPTIIFPNVSSENSGGGLKSGNTVYLGKFEANTAIGWFVVADAFKSGRLTQGKYFVYSKPGLNPEKDPILRSHAVLLEDSGNGKLILGFEDGLRDQGSDHDFNDMIFYISSNPYSAINLNDVVPIAKSTRAPGNNNNNTSNNTSNNGGGRGGNNNNNGGGNNGNGGNANNNNTPPAAEILVCYRDGIPLTNFNNLKATIKSQYVESNKPIVVKQAVKSKKVTVSQVKEIIKLFSVEQYKLDMAIYLFDFTCDKSNYYEINALLNAGRVRDLDNFLKDKDLSDDVVSNRPPRKKAPDNRYNTPNQYPNNNINNAYCDNGRMNPQDFEEIKGHINSKPFSDTKMTILKSAMPSRCISSAQVVDLLGIFSFESDKLAVAKYLYEFTTDKPNYYKVNDVFSFPSSTEELNKYIMTVR